MVRMISKVGIRAFGVAESFRLGDVYSIMVGVVMRGDHVIDGVVFGKSTVGGLDATDSIVGMLRSMGRDDIHLVMIDGCIVSWYNIISVDRIYAETGLPTVCLSFEEPSGNVEVALRELFSDYEARLTMYNELGKPVEIYLGGGLRVYARFRGMDYRVLRVLLRRFTREGKRPEPIRVARLIANALLKATKREPPGKINIESG